MNTVMHKELGSAYSGAKPIKVLAVASGGGHWEEMMLLKDGFANAEVVYANTFAGLAEKSGIGRTYLIRDCNRDTVLDGLRCAHDLWRLLRRERPDYVVSTG